MNILFSVALKLGCHVYQNDVWICQIATNVMYNLLPPSDCKTIDVDKCWIFYIKYIGSVVNPKQH